MRFYSLGLLLLNSLSIFAQSNHGQTKMVANAIAAFVFFGLVALFQSFKKKDKDNK